MSAGYTSARALRSGAASRVRVFPGQPARVAEARAFVAAALAGCPARETLLACVSELAANAIAHTASGDGGVFAVEVSRPADGRAMIAVTDAGGPGEPSIRDPDEMAERGRGLALVAALASRWGHHPAPGGARTVWAEVTWPVPACPVTQGQNVTLFVRFIRFHRNVLAPSRGSRLGPITVRSAKKLFVTFFHARSGIPGFGDYHRN